MLGDQFKNTYSLTDDGTAAVNGPEGTNLGWYEIKPSGSDELHASQQSNMGSLSGQNLQGMLFSPHTGTGTKHDPLVSSEQRTAAIESAYGLDKEKFGQSHQSETGKKAGARKVETERQMAIDSIRESGIPIQEMQKRREYHSWNDGPSQRAEMIRPGNPNVVVADASKSRSRNAGHYHPSSDRAWTQIEKRTQITRDVRDVPIAGDGEWLNNPKPMNMEEHRFYGFGDWDEGKPGEKPVPPTEDQIAEHKANKKLYKQQIQDYEGLVQQHGEESPDPRTGGVKREISYGKARTLADFPEDLPESLRGLGAYDLYGSGPRKPTSPKKQYKRDIESWTDRQAARDEFGISEEQLFSKPAPETNSKVFSQKVGTGYKYLAQGGDTDTEYWGRQNATEWEQREVTTRKNVPVVRESTMVHEIGHGVHMQGHTEAASNRKHNRKADPLEEGAADAYADKYSRYAEDHTSRAAASNPKRESELTMTGYGSDSDRWSNDTERALYRATRQSATMGDMPDRRFKQQAMQEATGGEGLRQMDESDLDFINRGNTMALGRMVSENPDLHSVFTPTGENPSHDAHIERMSKAASSAQQAYESAVNHRKWKAAGSPVEQQLPF